MQADNVYIKKEEEKERRLKFECCNTPSTKAC